MPDVKDYQRKLPSAVPLQELQCKRGWCRNVREQSWCYVQHLQSCPGQDAILMPFPPLCPASEPAPFLGNDKSKSEDITL